MAKQLPKGYGPQVPSGLHITEDGLNEQNMQVNVSGGGM